VNENHVWLNVNAQEAAEESTLKIFRKLVSLRNEPAIQFGTLHTTVVSYELVLVYARYDYFLADPGDSANFAKISANSGLKF
jgi:hypothetical protein